MNVFEIEAPSPEAARHIARQRYASIRAAHDCGRLLAEEPSEDVLDPLATLAPREMRRALVTGFGNARLAHRDAVGIDDLPQAPASKGRIGFTQ